MAKTRVALEIGMGTALQSHDYTKAAIRAVSDALWHNSLTMYSAFGFPRESMLIDVEIGTQAPDQVDCTAVAAVFPYGTVAVTSVKGGLDIPKPPLADNTPQGHTIMANAAVVVSFDMEKANMEKADTKTTAGAAS